MNFGYFSSSLSWILPTYQDRTPALSLVLLRVICNQCVWPRGFALGWHREALSSCTLFTRGKSLCIWFFRFFISSGLKLTIGNRLSPCQNAFNINFYRKVIQKISYNAKETHKRLNKFNLECLLIWTCWKTDNSMSIYNAVDKTSKFIKYNINKYLRYQ